MVWLREEYIERNDHYFVKGRIIRLPAFKNTEDQDINLNISRKFEARIVWL
jgi:hypothetical protein